MGASRSYERRKRDTSGQVISPLVYKAIDYDPVRSFEPIGLIAEGSIILVVNPLQRWRSVAELVADAKANAGKLNYGSAARGRFRT